MFTSLIASSGLQGVVEVPLQKDLMKYLETQTPGKVSFEEWNVFFKKYMAAQLV